MLRRILLLFSLTCAPGIVLADAGLSSGLQPDVRLLIDISGSMKVSDPDNLRAPALELIVRLLPEGSRAGVWIFGQEVELLVPHRVIDDQWRRDAQEAVAAIDNSGQRTNIPAALAAASYDLQQMDPAYRTSIVLLTDGKVDVAESPIANVSAARSLLSGLSLELGATGVPVHTIALSDEADWEFLRSLAENTDGIAEKAGSASDLSAIFLQSLEMVAPVARVPVAGSSFQIDSSVEEFTALMFFEQHSPGVGLLSPSGINYLPANTVEGVEWFSNQQFALVTVTRPEEGSWTLQVPADATTRVTVISNLQLEVDPLPNNLPTGRRAELGLRLREGGQLLTDPDVLALFDITVEVQGGETPAEIIDVSGQYPLPPDGEFRVTVPPFATPGRYQVLVRVAAQTLQRELPMILEVTATAADSTIVTRTADVHEQDLRQPLIGAAVLLFFVAVVTLAILRRRKRRRLELWRRRSLQADTTDASEEVLAGLRATPDE